MHIVNAHRSMLRSQTGGVAAPVAPTLVSATIPTGGTTISLVFSAAVAVGAGGNGGFVVTMSGGASAMTYASGSGSSTLVYSLARTVNSGETGTIAYTQPGNGIEAVSDGTDVVTFSGSSVVNNSTAGGAAITPSLIVEYVDTSGVRQTTTVATDGSTSISGVAPFLVYFDASGSRSTTSGATTAGGAWENLGYRINYGEALGTTWAYGGGTSRDEDTGPPVFGRAFTTTGTKTVRLRIKDSLGNESTIQLSVVVSAPPTATNIAVGAGAWPTWVSGTHYTLDRGSDYTSFGSINTDGLHNILISATGSGAFPIISQFQPDSRNIVGTAVTRARNNRLLNIDCKKFIWQAVGFDYCGIVFGRMRAIERGVPGFYYTDVAANATERDNLKVARGGFFWDTGEVNPPTAGDQYVLFGGNPRKFCFYGVISHKNGAADNHNMRTGGEGMVYRYMNMYSSVSCVNQFKMAAGAVDGVTGDFFQWTSDDRVGRSDGTGLYGYPTSKVAFHRNQMGRAGETKPGATISCAPQNNTANELHQYVAIEDCNAYDPTSMQTVNNPDVSLGGYYLSMRGCRLNLGAGSPWTLGGTNSNMNVVAGQYWGPYLYETTNLRPVPTAF